jgi:16S rRNA G1207 methylase RsmC
VAEHYFSENPAGEYKQRLISVTLAGVKAEVITASSVFSPEHIDQGTEVLLSQIDLAIPSGTLLDIGSGWGPIALSLGLHSPKSKIYAIDVNERSLELTKLNAEKLEVQNIVACKPNEVPDELVFDQIWSNPPIRIGKAALHEILLTWLPRLVSGGTAYLVIQKNLGSDSLQKWLELEFEQGYEVSRMTSIKSFRILKVSKL